MTDPIMQNAIMAYQENDVDKAYNLYEQCYSSDTTNFECLEGMASTAQKMGNFPKAK